MNQIVIKGRLTRDPETKSTQGGDTIAKFSVAVNRSYKDQSGNYPADFFNCTAWRGTGDFVAKYFGRGQEILLTGEMQSRKHTPDDGIERTYWEVNVAKVEFCGSKQDNAGQSGGTVQTGAFAGAADVDDGEMPF